MENENNKNINNNIPAGENSSEISKENSSQQENSTPQESSQNLYPSSQYRYTQDQIKQDAGYSVKASPNYGYSGSNAPYNSAQGNPQYSNAQPNPQYGNAQLNSQYSNTQSNNQYNSQYGNTPYGTQYSSMQNGGTGYTDNNSSGKKINGKKKRRVAKVFRFTAAALLFGILSGAVFQGYNYFTQPEAVIDEKNKDGDALKVAESEVNPTAVPTKVSSDEVVTDVSDVVANVMPSIVAINSSMVYTQYDFWGRQFNEPVEGSGSGIIIGQNGSEILIVTNNHVVEGADQVEIVFADKSTAQAVVKGAESKSDLAVLSVKLEDLTEDTLGAIKVATLGSSEEVQPGQMVIAIGNALGYGQSVTVGYISAVNRDVTIDNTTMTLIQTDAAINPGNSGGALINTAGEVIGINSVKYASKEVEGIGYAIPISDAVPMINELMNREEIKTSEQGFLGVYLDSAQNVTELHAERFNMPIGVYINEVVEDSPAANAGLKAGYIITGIDSHKIETTDDIVNVLSYRKAGETIKLKTSVLENGEYVEKTLDVTLGKK